MATTFDPLGLRVFEDAVTRLLSEPRGGRPWSPPVDILETEDALVLNADLPGVKMENVNIQLENQTLTLSGERNFERDDKVKGYHRIERSYGNFVRSFTVPSTVDQEKVSAEFHNGVLTVSLPKKPTAKPRQVRVELKG
jgi:HSP20 family protein